MSFKNELPEWQAQGTEPPQSLKEHGWQAGMKPPADYFNWLQYKAYKSLQELQQYAIHKDEKGKPNGVATLNDEGKVPSEQIDIDIDTSDLAKKQDFENLKSDYMYQIPTIVDAQIRINRLSDTNRLFFKLEDDLTGDITISTDGGTTEKPLVDVDENPITQLEKGFVEVVADANFFILRNRGISGSDKQALIDIVNEAERNESDLRQLFIDDINSKGASLTEHSTWFDALNALSNIEIGKKKEIGVKTVSSSSVAFEYADGSGTINSPSISIFDLDFLPSLIFTISVTNRTVTIYSDIDDGFYEKTVKKFSFGGNALGATSTRNLKGDVLPAFVNFGEFCIPTGSGEILWIAIE